MEMSSQPHTLATLPLEQNTNTQQIQGCMPHSYSENIDPTGIQTPDHLAHSPIAILHYLFNFSCYKW